MVDTMLTRVRGEVRARGGRTVLTLGSVILLVGLGLGLRLAGLAPNSGTVPSAIVPTALPESSIPPAGTPVTLPVDAQQLLARTVVAVINQDPVANNEWLAGSLNGSWTRLGVFADNSVVRSDWGTLITTRLDGGGFVVERLDPASAAREEIYRSADGGGSTTQAALSRDGASLVVFGLSVGVRLVDLGTGAVIAIVKPDAPLADQRIERSDVTWSPSGETVVSPVCDAKTCDVDVVHLGAGSVNVYAGFVPLAASDAFLVGYRSEEDRSWAALELATGTITPLTSKVSSPYDAIAVSDTEFLIYGSESVSGGVLHFAIMNAKSGAERLLVSDPTGESRLYDVLRSPTWALIGGPDGFGGAIGSAERWDLLRLIDGVRFVDTVNISSTVLAPPP